MKNKTIDKIIETAKIAGLCLGLNLGVFAPAVLAGYIDKKHKESRGAITLNKGIHSERVAYDTNSDGNPEKVVENWYGPTGTLVERNERDPTQEESERYLSRSIASHLMKHGQNPFTKDGSQKKGYPGHYQVGMNLQDGRSLRVYFCDINKMGVNMPMRNSRLEITLEPSNDSQVGYFTTESGLKGQFDEFRVLTGTEDRDWVHISRDNSKESLRDHTQIRYDKLKKEVYGVLTSNEKKGQ